MFINSNTLNNFQALKYFLLLLQNLLLYNYLTKILNSLNYNLFLEMMHLIYEFFSGIKRSGRENRWEPELDLYKSTC